MAMSEVFNLDFKFGGNAEFLVKLESLLQRIDARFDSFEDDVKESTQATDKMADAVDDLNDSFKEGVGAMSSFGEKLKDIAKYYLSFQAIRAGAERVWSFGMQSMDTFATQERAENQLKGVMKNRGNLDQFQAIKDYAAEIQGRSIYGDEAMIRGAGELATYVKGTGSLKSMMDLLTDYAAGMTGGGEVSPEQMESLATGLGMAYDGNYMAMRRKGFDTSKLEALDAIVENGGKWGAKEKQKYGDVLDDKTIQQIRKYKGVTEQMRVEALQESLKDWKGLSDAVNDLDSSALIRFNNKLGDLRENIGKKLYPVFNRLVDGIDKRMPDIEAAFDSVAEMFKSMATAIEENLGTIKDVVNILSALVTVVAKYPKASIAATVALKGLASGAIFAKKGFASLSVQLKSSFKDIIKMEGAIGGLVGSAGGGLAMGMTADVGSDKSFGENAMGALGAMAQGAAMGAAQFGAMGAAIGATAAVVGTLVKVFQELASVWDNTGLKAFLKNLPGVGSLFDNGKLSNDEKAAQKDQAFEKMMNARSRWKTEGAGAVGTKLYNDYVEAAKDYREWTGGLLPSYIQNEMYTENRQKAAADKLAKDAKKNGKVDVANTYNNTYIDQKVNVVAEVEKIGMLLNFSVRAAIEQAMRQNKNQMAVGAV